MFLRWQRITPIPQGMTLPIPPRRSRNDRNVCPRNEQVRQMSMPIHTDIGRRLQRYLGTAFSTLSRPPAQMSYKTSRSTATCGGQCRLLESNQPNQRPNALGPLASLPLTSCLFLGAGHSPSKPSTRGLLAELPTDHTTGFGTVSHDQRLCGQQQ